MTRGVVATLRFDLADAVLYHPFSLIVVPCFMAVALYVIFVVKKVSIQLTPFAIRLFTAVCLGVWAVKVAYVDQDYW